MEKKSRVVVNDADDLKYMPSVDALNILAMASNMPLNKVARVHGLKIIRDKDGKAIGRELLK